MNSRVRATVLIAIATCVGGCAALPLTLVGSLLGTVGSAASAGREIYSLGKLDSAEPATLAEAVAAVDMAAGELGLKPKPAERSRKSKDPTIVETAFLDDKGAQVGVRVERRAARLVWVRIDVGLLGSEVTAHLFLNRLREHLPEPDRLRPRVEAPRHEETRHEAGVRPETEPAR